MCILSAVAIISYRGELCATPGSTNCHRYEMQEDKNSRDNFERTKDNKNSVPVNINGDWKLWFVNFGFHKYHQKIQQMYPNVDLCYSKNNIISENLSATKLYM